jgi:hypothetical protein
MRWIVQQGILTHHPLVQPTRIHDVLSQGGTTTRNERDKLVRQLVATKRFVIKEPHGEIGIGVRLEELVKLRDVAPDTTMGVRFKPWVESAEIETYGDHAP